MESRGVVCGHLWTHRWPHRDPNASRDRGECDESRGQQHANLERRFGAAGFPGFTRGRLADFEQTNGPGQGRQCS